MRQQPAKQMLLLLVALVINVTAAGEEWTGSRLLATAGTSSIEGTAGGGITPWTMLSGYGDKGEFGCAVGLSQVSTSDYALDTTGLGCTFNNRLEFSFARQELDIEGLRPALGLPASQTLRQKIFGVKVRIAGDVVYGRFGQVSAGILRKESEDKWLVRVAGAGRTVDTEAYLSGGKLFIDGPFGNMAYLNLGVRWTRANQIGLLGFGGDGKESRSLNMEFAAAVFPRRDLALGVEYRQKPDNLSFAGEDDWYDFFVAWFPSKYTTLTLAWTELGSVGTLTGQDGAYLSLGGSF